MHVKESDDRSSSGALRCSRRLRHNKLQTAEEGHPPTLSLACSAALPSPDHVTAEPLYTTELSGETAERWSCCEPEADMGMVVSSNPGGWLCLFS